MPNSEHHYIYQGLFRARLIIFRARLIVQGPPFRALSLTFVILLLVHPLALVTPASSPLLGLHYLVRPSGSSM